MVLSIFLDEVLDEYGELYNSTFTIPEIDFEANKDDSKENEKFDSYLGNLKSYQFNHECFVKLRKTFLEVGVAKIITNKIFNLLSNYNDSIRDPIMFIYFIELKSGLDKLVSFIYNYKDHGKLSTNLVSFQKNLTVITDELQTGFYNRYQNSHSLLEVSDTNLEFKGGIHQIVSAYDVIYKIFTKAIGIPGGFTRVSSMPNVTSSQFSLLLNNNHLFQPEIFISILAHEAANGFLEGNLENTNLLTCFRKLKARKLERINHLIGVTLGTDIARYFLVDSISFIIGYQEDFKLFMRWHFYHMVQINDSYSNANQLNQFIVHQNFIRIFLLASVLDLDSNEGYMQFRNDVRSYYEKQLNNDYFKNINNDLIEFKEDFIALWNAVKVTLFDFRQIKNLIISSDFNEILRLISEGSKNNFKFALVYLNYYLKEKYLNPILPDDKLYFLKRNDSGVAIKGQNALSANYLFDSRGGLFTFNPLCRGEHFHKSTYFMRQLWALGNVCKLNQLNGLIGNKIADEEFNFPGVSKIFGFLSGSTKNGLKIKEIIEDITPNLYLDVYFFTDNFEQTILHSNIVTKLEEQIKRTAWNQGFFIIEYSKETLTSPYCLWEVLIIYKNLKILGQDFSSNRVLIIPPTDSSFGSECIADDYLKGVELIFKSLIDRVANSSVLMREFMEKLYVNNSLSPDFSSAINNYCHEVGLKDKTVTYDKPQIQGIVNNLVNS